MWLNISRAYWLGIFLLIQTALGFATDEPSPGTVIDPPQSQDNILAASWQPGFCETAPEKRECRTQTPQHHDAVNFSLHGLWPKPRDNSYCGGSSKDLRADKRGHWSSIEALDLSAKTRHELKRLMPGMLSHLHRHEWIRHGTCYSKTPERYYVDSISLLNALNESAVRDLFAENINRRLTIDKIRKSFDKAFGSGAGKRVSMFCRTVRGKNIILELRISLRGLIDSEMQLADLILAAPPASKGCYKGLVDEAGF